MPPAPPTTRYLALLRGVNVGGKSLVKMPDLARALTGDGLVDVTTYIASGNVLFSSDSGDTAGLGSAITACIDRAFSLAVAVAVLSAAEWQRIVAAAPAGWGTAPDSRHNLIVMLGDASPSEVVAALPPLKPDVDALEVGHRVLYQSNTLAGRNRSVLAKLVSAPIYKKVTIRNSNTTLKLAALLAS